MASIRCNPCNSASRLYINPESERVELGDGYWMYAQEVVRVRNWPQTGDVDVHLGHENGRLIAERIEIRRAEGSPPLSSELIREIPVSHLVRYGRDGIFRDTPEIDEQIARIFREARESGKPAAVIRSLGDRAAWPNIDEVERIRAEGTKDDFYRLVARIYRVAYLINIPPTKQVEASLETSRATAGRWVAAARERGFLPPAEPGKAGA